MGWFLIAVLLVLPQTQTPAPGKAAGDDRNDPSSVTQQRKEHQKETNPSPVQGEKGSGSTKENGSDETPKEKQWHVIIDGVPDKDLWDKIYICLTAALVLIATVTLGAIWYQARQTARAAKATEVSAKAARDNAQAIIDSERAWVTARPVIWSPELRALWEPGDIVPVGQNMQPWVHLFPVRFQNSGKTPAQMDEIFVCYNLIGSLSELKDKPEYGKASPQNGHLLVPNDEVIVSVPLSDGGMLKKWQLAAIRNQQLFLYAYGFIGYRDFYERPHVTRFGYVYNFPQGGRINFEEPSFKRDGPPEYNKAT